jgi:hypothetical protein
MKQNISQKQQFFLHGVGNRFFIPKFNIKSKIRLLYLYILKKAKKMSDKFKEIFENATSQGYRSNVVKPLMGFLIITFIFTAVFVYLEINILAYITFGISGLTALVFLSGYIYCLIKNPDLLRSEKYNLEKTAIEKIAIKGDSTSEVKIISPEMDYVVVESMKDISLKTLEK